MLRYARGSEVGMDVLFVAFRRGFSDYIIQFKLDEANFAAKFFGPEGNQREHSFVALDGEEAVGIVLGGVKMYESVKTMRCGALAVSPEYRGKGVSGKLMDLHRGEAEKMGCRQLFLEVIVGNDRAISFYQKRGYRKVYDQHYYTLTDAARLGSPPVPEGCRMRRLAFEEFAEAVNARKYFHVNWQNDLEYQQLSEGNVYFGIFRNDELAGCLSVNGSGKINMLLVDRRYRGKGIASHLLAAARDELGIAKFTASTPSNALLEGFLERSGFIRESLRQYEMYLPLGS
ncbi:GNAT family N-acetyltransferase [Paenibacillus oralis]|uniref:GNAT family N-acetyltransferase n=1 Tax=Paenibacillus oralis TaxID=2490856 RepID=A0A3P3TYU2_9BACL|nr:GNAT family N-acetyltransferase [Paenibacillus oralis]RRJ62529.1 GNAT family N-acetyltransferase [Paenibacillus oralis]